MRSKWLSRHERDFFCCEFSRFGADRAALAAEIVAAQGVIARQPPNSTLVAVDLYSAPLTPELVGFLRDCDGPAGAPIHKLALIGLAGLRVRWLRLTRRLTWPHQARGFYDWEAAKDWLVMERF